MAHEVRALDPQRGLDIVRQILHGVAFAHARGVMHRDLKPGNVFLQEMHDGKDHVKILDFGLAKLLYDEDGTGEPTLTKAGMILGTPAYMAPEQAAGSKCDLRVDVYSAGVVLFELITGSNLPSAGSVRIGGRDIHRVRYRERDRLAIHYHQSYQVRRFHRTVPAFMLERAASDYPLVHLFDEPQFNTQDGYIGFMLDFFRRLRSEDRVVFLCLHPTEGYHLEILREVCERFVFVEKGRISLHPNFAALEADARVSAYLGQSA